MTGPDFDRMYTDEPDPWRVGSSWYERRKIAVVLASLSESSYHRALDPACGTAHLALALKARCAEVLAYDASEPAIRVARQVCSSSSGIRLGVASVPYPAAGGPNGPFDLIVLSEFLYYAGDLERAEVIESVIARAADRVEFAAVHWRDRPEDGSASGDDVHAELRAMMKDKGFRHQVAHFDEEFVFDIFTRGHETHLD